MAEALVDELVEEILLRIAPDDPARLFLPALAPPRLRPRLPPQVPRVPPPPASHARLPEGPWRHLRRRAFHFHPPPPPPPIFIPPSARFVPTSPAARPADRIKWHALDSRHGRVLLHKFYSVATMAVWDPIMGEQVDLPRMPKHASPYAWNAAVLCAAAGGGGGGGCDHIGCHFLVVFVGCDAATGIFTCIYSSKSGAWSEVASAKPMRIYGSLRFHQPVLAGNALYV
ncbi:unnamed protein product [Urochloa humidicola]